MSHCSWEAILKLSKNVIIFVHTYKFNFANSKPQKFELVLMFECIRHSKRNEKNHTHMLHRRSSERTGPALDWLIHHREGFLQLLRPHTDACSYIIDVVTRVVGWCCKAGVHGKYGEVDSANQNMLLVNRRLLSIFLVVLQVDCRMQLLRTWVGHFESKMKASRVVCHVLSFLRVQHINFMSRSIVFPA